MERGGERGREGVRETWRQTDRGLATYVYERFLCAYVACARVRLLRRRAHTHRVSPPPLRTHLSCPICHMAMLKTMAHHAAVLDNAVDAILV